MYGRDGEIGTADLSFLIGSYLTQVCLGAHDLGLVFSGPSTNVMISSAFGFQISGHHVSKHDIVMGHLLRPFLNRDVAQAAWAELGTLILTFDNGDQIHVFDDSDQFESYIVTHGPVTIVV